MSKPMLAPAFCQVAWVVADLAAAENFMHLDNIAQSISLKMEALVGPSGSSRLASGGLHVRTGTPSLTAASVHTGSSTTSCMCRLYPKLDLMWRRPVYDSQ